MNCRFISDCIKAESSKAAHLCGSDFGFYSHTYGHLNFLEAVYFRKRELQLCYLVCAIDVARVDAVLKSSIGGLYKGQGCA